MAAQGSGEVGPVHLHPFTVEDLFRLQELGENFGGPYAYSGPTGALAVTILRALDTGPSQRWNELSSGTLQSNATGDVWVAPATGKPLTNITHGSSDRSGWFSPQWSPDGVHLAMLSTRGGALRLWTWNRLTGRLRPLSSEEVAFSLQQRAALHDQPYVWVDSKRILCTVFEKEPPLGVLRTYEYMGSETPALATIAWQRYLSGTHSTASVLDNLGDRSQRSGVDIVLVDTEGRERVVAKDIDTLLWQPSPTAGAVAFTRRVNYFQKVRRYRYPWAEIGAPARLEVVTIGGRRIATTGEKSLYVMPTSLHWSPDGRTLAYFGYASESQAAPSLYLLDMRTNRVRSVSLGALNAAPYGRYPNRAAGYRPPGLRWTASGQLLVRGARMGEASRDSSPGKIREDWWLIQPDHADVCLTCRLDDAPLSLWPEGGRVRFFGVGGGKLWQVDTSAIDVRDLTKHFQYAVTALMSPTPSSIIPFGYSNRTRKTSTYARSVFLAIGHGIEKPYLIDLSSDVIIPLLPPVPGADLVSVAPGGNSLLYLRKDRSGMSLWRQAVRSRKSTSLFMANGFLREVAGAQLVHFPYTSLDGKKLIAWLLLPLGYRPGRRYPMITFVYPTYNYSAQPTPWQIEFVAGLSSDSPYNMQIAAAHGYAVLFPSVPVTYRERKEVRIKVVNEALPAVLAATRRGYADPQRLAVWGLSYGGEAVFDLLTRTDIFKAAIVSSGVSDLISAYGALDARYRYGDRAEDEVELEFLIEGGEFNLGSPPWRHRLLYIENSPVFSVNRVHTPLLITDGDLDFVSMQQSEEFFRALVRQNKPVRFVRYWGEGHGMENPANIRDYWHQAFKWLERYLPPDPPDRVGH